MVLIKKKHKGELNHLVSLLQNSSKRNKPFLIFKTKKNYSYILNKLSKGGFIKSFSHFSELYIIYLKNSKNKGFIDIGDFRRVGRKASVSHFTLNKLLRREGGVPLFLLNTDLGLLSGSDCLNKFVGGKILLKVN